MNEKNPYETPQSDVADGVADEYGDIKIFSFSGRIGRIRYLGYSIGFGVLIQFINGLLTAGIIAAIGPGGLTDTVGIAFTITGPVAVVFISMMFTAKRLHDVNWSGWFSLLMLIPIVNLILGLGLVFTPGNDSENRFGLKPPPNNMMTYIFSLILPLIFIAIMAAIAIPSYQQYVKRAEMQSLEQR